MKPQPILDAIRADLEESTRVPSRSQALKLAAADAIRIAVDMLDSADEIDAEVKW